MGDRPERWQRAYLCVCTCMFLWGILRSSSNSLRGPTCIWAGTHGTGTPCTPKLSTLHDTWPIRKFRMPCSSTLVRRLSHTQSLRPNVAQINSLRKSSKQHSQVGSVHSGWRSWPGPTRKKQAIMHETNAIGEVRTSGSDLRCFTRQEC